MSPTSRARAAAAASYAWSGTIGLFGVATNASATGASCCVAVSAPAHSPMRRPSPPVNTDAAAVGARDSVVVVVGRQRPVQVVEVIVPAPRVGVGRRFDGRCRRVEQRPRRADRERDRRAAHADDGGISDRHAVVELDRIVAVGDRRGFGGCVRPRTRQSTSRAAGICRSAHVYIIRAILLACRVGATRDGIGRTCADRESANCRRQLVVDVVARDRAVQAAVRDARARARRSRADRRRLPTVGRVRSRALGADTLLRTALPVGIFAALVWWARPPCGCCRCGRRSPRGGAARRSTRSSRHARIGSR